MTGVGSTRTMSTVQQASLLVRDDFASVELARHRVSTTRSHRGLLYICFVAVNAQYSLSDQVEAARDEIQAQEVLMETLCGIE